MKSRKFNKRYDASLVCQKTRKRNILQVFSMSNFINIQGDYCQRHVIENDCYNDKLLVKPPQQSILEKQLSASRQFDMSYSYCYQGPTCQLELFFTMRCPKQPDSACPFYNIGASARPMVAFSGFYESHKPPPLGDARGIVPAHRDGHQNSQQSGFILHRCTVCCRPGGCRGNKERVVTRWRHLVASIKALDLLHQAMCAVSHHHTAMVIEMA